MLFRGGAYERRRCMTASKARSRRTTTRRCRRSRRRSDFVDLSDGIETNKDKPEAAPCTLEMPNSPSPPMMFCRLRRLGHLVVMAVFRVVEFVIRLAVVMRQKVAAEAQRVQLDDRCQRERMQPPKATVFVEELLRHGKNAGTRSNLLTSLTRQFRQPGRQGQTPAPTPLISSSGFSRSCGMESPNRLFCRKNTRQSDDLEVLSTA